MWLWSYLYAKCQLDSSDFPYDGTVWGTCASPVQVCDTLCMSSMNNGPVKIKKSINLFGKGAPRLANVCDIWTKRFILNTEDIDWTLLCLVLRLFSEATLLPECLFSSFVARLSFNNGHCFFIHNILHLPQLWTIPFNCCRTLTQPLWKGAVVPSDRYVIVCYTFKCRSQCKTLFFV